MNLQEISGIASKYGVVSGTMSKAELIRAIQRAEGYVDCFLTRVTACSETGCLWRDDCMQKVSPSLSSSKILPSIVVKTAQVPPAKSRRARLPKKRTLIRNKRHSSQ